MLTAMQPLARLLVCVVLTLGLSSRGTSGSFRSTGETRNEDMPPGVADVFEDVGLESPDVEAALPAPNVPGGGRALPLGPEPDAEVLYRVCRVTAYCDRGTTAAGVPSGVGQCAAPGYVPLGSLVYIPALDETFVVTDRTHRRFRNSTIDIFMPSKKACRQFGRHFEECEIIIDGPEARAQRLGRR